MLSKSRLYYFDAEKISKPQGVINFKIARCDINKNNDQ